jgi:hypothetical protein
MRAQKSLVDDITSVVKGSNIDEVRARTSPHDIRATKQHAEVSPDIFMSVITLFRLFNFCVSYSIFCQLFCVSYIFVCQPFSCDNHFLCVSHFVI